MPIRYDTTKIQDKIKKSHKKPVDLARRIGITPQTLNGKIHGQTRFNVPEAYILCRELGIPLEDMCEYFN